MTGADRVRRHRERQREGRACYMVEADTVDVEHLLESEGLLAPLSEHSHADIEVALSRLVAALCLIEANSA
jgi:hypothetical protein